MRRNICESSNIAFRLIKHRVVYLRLQGGGLKQNSQHVFLRVLIKALATWQKVEAAHAITSEPTKQCE